MAARTTPNDLMATLQKEHWGKFIGVAASMQATCCTIRCAKSIAARSSACA
jgi:hypothetical protein